MNPDPSKDNSISNRAFLLQAMLDSHPASMFSVDLQYRYTAFNRSHVQMMKALYAAEIEPGGNYLDYIKQPADQAAAQQDLNRALNGETFLEKARTLGNELETIFYDFRYTPIRDDDGSVVGASVIAEDVTSLIKNAETQKINDQLFSDLFQQINSIILIVDPKSGAILDANQSACAFYGYSHPELTNLKIMDLVELPPEEVFRRMQKVVAREIHHLSHAHKLSGGETRQVDVYTGPFEIRGRQVLISVIHDVTDRERAEKALRESEEHYKAQYKNLPLPSYTWQKQGDDFILVDYNDMALAITDGGAARLLGKKASELYADRPDVLVDFQECYTTHNRIGREMQMTLRSTGETREFYVTYVYIAPDLVIGHTEDITERKRLASELQEKTDFLTQIINNLGQGLTVTNSDRQIELVNPAFARLLGYTTEEMIGMRPRDLTAPEDIPSIEQARDLRLEGTTTRLETMMVRADGSHVPVLVASSPRYKNGKYAGTISVFTDLTDVKRAEDLRHASEERFNKAFRASPIGIITLRASDGALVDANETFLELLEYKREQILGRLPEELNLFSGPVEKANWFQTLLAQGSIKNWETVLRTSSGENRNALFSIEELNLRDESLFIALCVDITGQKRDQARIAEALDFNQTILQASPVGILIYKASGACVEANAAAEQIIGTARENLLTQSFHELQSWKTSGLYELALHVLETGQPHSGRFHFTSTFGKELWLYSSMAAFTSAGEPHLLVMYEDHTQRQAVESALQKSEEMLGFVLEGSQLGFTDWDIPSSRITRNRQWAEMIGYQLDEIENSFFQWEELIHPEDKPLVMKSLQDHLEGRCPAHIIEYRLRCKDGGYKWILDQATVTQRTADGKPLRISGTQADITERKLVQNQLEESRRKYQLIFEEAGILLWEEDFSAVEREFEELRAKGVQDWRTYFDDNPEEVKRLVSLVEISDVNKETLRFFDAQDKSEIIRNLPFYLVEESWPVFKEELIALAQGEAYFETEVPFLTLYGERKELLVKLSVASMDRKNLSLVIVSFIDITSRKQVEAALLSAHTRLEERVHERTMELESANLALGKALRARDEFLATMSHELRTPLTGILGLSQSLQGQLKEIVSPKQLNLLHTIELSGKRLHELITDVLDFSRCQAGSLGLTTAVFLLRRTCKASIQAVQDMANGKNQELVFNISPENIIANADERRVKQILTNLLGNAIKFTPQNGRISLEVNGLAEEKQIRICIKDNGIGIQPHALADLFQPFTQLDTRLSREYSGTGLGLALVKNLVELHHGCVKVESTFGQGSVFSVYLPWDGSTSDLPTSEP